MPEVAEIVASLVKVEGCDISQNDSMGNPPLAWAAKNGHEGVVKILLGRDDIDPNKPGDDGQTPLLWAARNGHQGVVRVLLKRDDVDPNKLDRHSQTPILCKYLQAMDGTVVDGRKIFHTEFGRFADALKFALSLM